LGAAEGWGAVKRWVAQQRENRIKRMAEATPKLRAQTDALDTEVSYLEAKAALVDKRRKIAELRERIRG
jgi:hypothetical protein